MVRANPRPLACKPGRILDHCGARDVRLGCHGMVRQRPPTVTDNWDPAPAGSRRRHRPVKRFAGWLDVTGMVTQAQPALAGNETGHWWPSKYGPEDQAGALNELTPRKVLEAVRLVRHGRAYDLAHVLHQDIPAFPGRTFRQYLTTNYHH